MTHLGDADHDSEAGVRQTAGSVDDPDGDATGASARLLRSGPFPGDWTPITAKSLQAELVPTGGRITVHEQVPTTLLRAREDER